MKILTYSNHILFYTFSVLFFIYAIFFGFDNIDSGFIISFVNKIENGEVIYKDFDYIRPFGTPVYWHIILKPFLGNKYYLYIICRILIIIQFWIIAYNISRIILSKNIWDNKMFFLIPTFSILAINYFPIENWHTIDGLFFLSFSIFYLHKKNILLAILFSLFAFTTKQPFLAPLVFLLIISILLRRKYYYKVSLKLAILITTFLTIILVYSIPMAISYYQNSSNAGINELLQTGFWTYVDSLRDYRPYLVILFCLIFCLFFKTRINLIQNNSLIFMLWGFILIYFSIPIIKFLYLEIINNNHLPEFIIRKSINSLIPLLLIYIVIKYYILNQYSSVNDFILDLFSLLICWSSSISWGYNNIQLSLPFLFIIFRNCKFSNILPIYTFLVFVCIMLRMVNPYFETSILKTKYTRIKNIPVYSGIFTEQKNIDYLKESKNLYNKYKDVLFLPAFPAASVMYNEPSIRAPWEMDVEFANQKNIYTDLKKFENKKIFYIIDKQDKVNSKEGFSKSTFTQYIRKYKTKIDSTSHFYIYH